MNQKLEVTAPSSLVWKLLIFACTVSIGIFLLIVGGRPFSLAADDFYFLEKMYRSGGLEFFRDYGAYVSRVPLQSFLMWGMYKTHFINDQGFGFYYVMNGVHTASFTLLVWGWLKALKCHLHPYEILSVAVLCALGAQYPNYYEVTYWATSLSFIWGALFMVSGLIFEKSALRWILLLAAFMVSEMYITASLAYIVLEHFFRHETRTDSKFKIWLGALMTYLMVRGVTSLFVGSAPSKISLGTNLFTQPFSFLQHLLFLDFHKIYYPLSMLFLVPVVIACVRGFQTKWMRRPTFVFVLGGILLSGSHYFLMRYTAPRALYASQLFFMSLLVVGAFLGLRRSPKLYTGLLLVVGLSFIFHGRYIFGIKERNFSTLQKKEAELVKQLKNCSDPCVLDVQNLGSELVRDWVLPEENYVDFVRYVAHKHGMEYTKWTLLQKES